MARPRHPVPLAATEEALDQRRALTDDLGGAENTLLARAREKQRAMPRLMVVEDNASMREALRNVFRGRAEVVVYETLADAEAHAAEHWDAMVIDRFLPDGDALAFALAMGARKLGIPIIFLSACDPHDVLERTNALGIIFAGKPDGISHVYRLGAQMDALRAARALGDTLRHRLERLEERAQAWRLTERELDVARLAVEGLARKEKAARLGIEPGTVQAHVGKLLKKSGFDRVSRLLASLDFEIPLPTPRKRS